MALWRRRVEKEPEVVSVDASETKHYLTMVGLALATTVNDLKNILGK